MYLRSNIIDYILPKQYHTIGSQLWYKSLIRTTDIWQVLISIMVCKGMWQPKMFMILCFNFPFHQRFRSHINNEQLFLHVENKKTTSSTLGWKLFVYKETKEIMLIILKINFLEVDGLMCTSKFLSIK